jgi:hypothetical protein
MDTPPFTLGPDEQRRLYVLTELLAGRLTTIEAALALEVSIRHLKRMKARYRREGVASLAHGNRGRRPWYAIDPALAGREEITLKRSTIRRVLIGAGLRMWATIQGRLVAELRLEGITRSRPRTRTCRASSTGSRPASASRR